METKKKTPAEAQERAATGWHWKFHWILPRTAPPKRANSLWALQDSNLRPSDYESAALTD